jgi:hypothetical protein
MTLPDRAAARVNLLLSRPQKTGWWDCDTTLSKKKGSTTMATTDNLNDAFAGESQEIRISERL